MKKLTSLVARLSGEISLTEEAAREKFKFASLTLTQMHYLETISNLGNPNITELARSLKLTKPTVTVAVEKLIEKEYICKVRSDEDRRSTHLHLTEKGKLINKMHDYAHQRIAETLKSKLEKNELKVLIELMEKVFRNS